VTGYETPKFRRRLLRVTRRKGRTSPGPVRRYPRLRHCPSRRFPAAGSRSQPLPDSIAFN